MTLALAAAAVVRRRRAVQITTANHNKIRFLRNFCTSTGEENYNNVFIDDHDNLVDVGDDDPLMFKEEFEVGSHHVSFRTGHRMSLKSYRSHIRPRSCLTNKWSDREAVIMDMGKTNKLLSVVKVAPDIDHSSCRLGTQVKRKKFKYLPTSGPSICAVYVEKPFLDAQRLIHSAQQKKFPSQTLLRRPHLKDIIRKSIARLFPIGYYQHDVFASVGVVKSDGEQDPIIMGANATSAALMLSDIAWGGPVGVVRIGRVNGKFVINPGMDQMLGGSHDLDLVYACTRDRTLMIELQACEVSDRDVEAALRLAHNEAVKYIEPQIRLAERAGKLHNKKDYKFYLIPDHLENKVESLVEPQIEAVIDNHPDNYRFYEDKSKRELVSDEVIQNVKEEVVSLMGKECSSTLLDDKGISRFQRCIVDKVMKNVIKRRIMEKGLRVDGRLLGQVRELVYCESGNLPVCYGSSIFWLGDTQVLCRVSLKSRYNNYHSGSDLDHDKYENLDDLGLASEVTFSLMNPYGFPFVEHDEKDFLAVLPPLDDFPYKVGFKFEVMSSSDRDVVLSKISYTETICGASLALMDAGIPLKRHVAGVSMGLVSDVDPSTGIIKDHCILTDIDHRHDLELGDMYMRIAGTRKGITSMRLGKVIGDGIGIPLGIICECFEPALKARLQILDHMEQEIDAPRRTSSDFIDQNGRNWRTCSSSEYNYSSNDLDFLRSLQVVGPADADQAALQICSSDKSTRSSSSSNGKSNNKEKAQEKVRSNYCRGFEVGGVYEAVVFLIREDDCAFVEIQYTVNGGVIGPIGFLHNSEMLHDDDVDVDNEQRKKISPCHVSLGQRLSVKCIGYDTRGFLNCVVPDAATTTTTVPAPNE